MTKRKPSTSRKQTPARIGQRSGIDETPCMIKRHEIPIAIAAAIAIRRKPIGI